MKEWVIGGIAGGLTGFAIGYFFKVPYTKWRLRCGFDSEHRIHHADVGTSIAMLGQLAGEHAIRPAMTGFGVGLAVEDYVGHFLPSLVPQPSYERFNREDAVEYMEGVPDVEQNEDVDQEYDDDVLDFFNQNVESEDITESLISVTDADNQSYLPTKRWKHIADWPPELRTAQMTSVIRDLILEDAHDPIVRQTAEDIIVQGNLDGHDHETICRIMQQWVLENIRYVNDEVQGPKGEGTDRYAHSYITLPPAPNNPLGRGLGDCDDLVIAYLSMCQSVGINEVCGLLIDQSGRGYNHIMAAYVPGGRTPKSLDDVQGIELTEDKPFGWIPRCKKAGFLIL